MPICKMPSWQLWALSEHIYVWLLPRHKRKLIEHQLKEPDSRLFWSVAFANSNIKTEDLFHIYFFIHFQGLFSTFPTDSFKPDLGFLPEVSKHLKAIKIVQVS